MTIRSLILQSIRTYPQRTFTFTKPITIIQGPNAIGKTNILESIYALASGGSFRAEKETDMIHFDSDVGRITGSIVIDEKETIKLEIMITHGVLAGMTTQTKRYFVDGLGKRKIDFVGNFFAVLFCPTDLELVTDSPSLRRTYLNSVLIQTDREYHKHLQAYDHAIRQRNALLEAIAEGVSDRSQLDYWNSLVIEHGTYITQKRESFITYINSCTFSDLSYRISYDKSVISQERLIQYKDAEVGAHTTLVGPHRDDIAFFKRGHPKFHKTHLNTNEVDYDVGRFGSRGEQRLVILWLKLGESSYIESIKHIKPIMLLDDIFSELDIQHQELVMTLIDNQQTFITTAEERKELIQEKNIDVIRL